jgi:hypothetical protein
MHLLKARVPTVIKFLPATDGESFDDNQKFNLKPEDAPLLVRSIEISKSHPSFFEIELREPMNGFFQWFAFIAHVEKQFPSSNWIMATTSTIVKRRPVDADTLDDDEKFKMPIKAQPLLANWVKDRQRQKHFEVDLMIPHNGLRRWFVFKEHVAVEGSPLRV